MMMMTMMFSGYDMELPKTNFRRISRSAASRTGATGVWGSLASNSKIPSATTSVGLDQSGPAECGGHLRAIQRYHPRPLRSVWTKVVRPSVGVTREPFNDAPSATTSVGLDESGPAECGVTCEQFKEYPTRDHFGRKASCDPG